MTVLQELIKEFEEIKKTNCKTMQEMMFFDGVLAIIEGEYIEKEREQIIQSFLKGKFEGGGRLENSSVEYYEKLSSKSGS